MMPSLLVVATLTAPGAPIPRDTTPNPSGPAPRVAAVRIVNDGGPGIVATVIEKRKVLVPFAVIENGKQVIKQQEQEITTSMFVQKEVADFGGKFMLADGTILTSEQATRRVKQGATILVSMDGKPVDRGWLQGVAGDTVIMLTDELARAHFQFGHSGLPSTPPPRLVMLGADDKGAVRLAVNLRAGNPNQAYIDDFGGLQNGAVRVFRGVNGRMIVNNVVMPAEQDNGKPTVPAGTDGKKALADIGFDAYDLNGKLIPKSEAVRRLKGGGLVLFAGDNRFPDPDYLKVFHNDLIVLASSELVFPPGQPNPYDPPEKKTDAVRPAAGVGAAQLIPPPAIPVAPVIRVQVAPANIGPARVAPPAPPKPAPANPAGKPAEKAPEVKENNDPRQG